MIKRDFKRKLGEQRQFLMSSCWAYDSGQKAEAVRIATIIRVLLHNSGKSTSLLTHLGAKSLQLYCSVPDRPADATRYFFGMGSGRELPDGTVELVPNLDTGPPGKLVSAEEWWWQLIFALETGETLTRRDVVLAAANQDGGAHVDSDLDPTYLALATDGAGGAHLRRVGDHFEVDNSRDLHLVSLRQMGYELLESTELWNLCI
jgi:hypothetical protein